MRSTARVPHHLHAQIYCDIIRAGKHLLGEKPFGIDLAANEQILAELRGAPRGLCPLLVGVPLLPRRRTRSSSICAEGRFGQIIEVEAGFWHSSDLDPQQADQLEAHDRSSTASTAAWATWGCTCCTSRSASAGCRATCAALLSKIVTERPDGKGGMAPCETWDNAILACEVQTADQHFPMLLSTKRIAPGETNTWFIKIHGTEFSAEFTTKYPRTLRTMTYRPGKPQSWEVLDLGYTPAYPTITGGIFEFGFSDSILQMFAAFCDELVHGAEGMRQPFRCATPEETNLHHRVLTAALESERRERVISLS